jgi:hypothetical protein
MNAGEPMADLKHRLARLERLMPARTDHDHLCTVCNGAVLVVFGDDADNLWPYSPNGCCCGCGVQPPVARRQPHRDQFKLAIVNRRDAVEHIIKRMEAKGWYTNDPVLASQQFAPHAGIIILSFNRSPAGSLIHLKAGAFEGIPANLEQTVKGKAQKV